MATCPLDGTTLVAVPEQNIVAGETVLNCPTHGGYYMTGTWKLQPVPQAIFSKLSIPGEARINRAYLDRSNNLVVVDSDENAFTITSAAGALASLTDVTITTPADNEILAYDSGSSERINQTPGEANLVDLSTIQSLSNKTLAGATLTGVIDASAADPFILPSGTAPTIDAVGEFALDTDVTDHTPLLRYHDGTEGFLVIAIPTDQLTATDGHVISYNAADNEFEMSAAGSGAPVAAQYVTLATDATLSAERVLTGTANEITLTDNGAGSTVVVSIPASPVFTLPQINDTSSDHQYW